MFGKPHAPGRFNRLDSHDTLAAATTSRRRFIPLLGGLLGIALASAGELLIEAGNRTPLSLVLYLLGIAAFAISAWARWSTAADTALEAPAEELPKAANRRRAWAIMSVGVGLAVLLNIAALLRMQEQFDAPESPYLWLGSMLVVLITGVALARLQGWSARWGAKVWPATPRGRLLLLAAVLLILTIATAARLLWLDRIPFGLNADEGDRAAVSIQIVRGHNKSSIFDIGWYWISMVYFWLLAMLMKVIGIGYVQARVFGAIAGIISVAAITWLGSRHFGLRVGLLAGALLSVLAVALQFSRETSEAGPTGALWAVSFALLLEGARRGRAYAWIGAGLAGGLSIYFYPTGRLWVVVAALFCLYLLVHGLGVNRLTILRGCALTGIAALLAVSPFIAYNVRHPGVFEQRAKETTIFSKENPYRLSYYRPEWNIVQLLMVQTERSVGLFNQERDGGGFWPTDRPLMSGLLSVLTLLGIGWACVRWRDPRFVLLALWFWVGISGVIVTVETPNVQRLATAIPALALFPALVLDSLAKRVGMTFSGSWRRVLAATWATAAAAVVVGYLMWTQGNFYFVDYAGMDRWPRSTIEGQAVANQGTNTLVTTLGRDWHAINSGWVRLLAPFTPRGGIAAPGSNLPLNIPADHNLAFMVYPGQEHYLPYLRSIYPGGETTSYTHPIEGPVVTAYRISREQWSATQGAMAQPPQGQPVRVPALGAVPPGWGAYPSPMRWYAMLAVPQYWNYHFRIGPGPSRLAIDGVEVLTVLEGNSTRDVIVSLARGGHYIQYDGMLSESRQPATFLWAQEPEQIPGQTTPEIDWQQPRAEDLNSGVTASRGLLGIVRINDTAQPKPEQRRIDGTLATCCLSDQVGISYPYSGIYTATWAGTLHAPATGTYSMALFSQGIIELRIDDRQVIYQGTPSDQTTEGAVELAAGPHAIRVEYKVQDSPGGLEWTWTTPGGVKSIVPPEVLAPPPGAGVGDPVPPSVLGKREFYPVEEPLKTIP